MLKIDRHFGAKEAATVEERQKIGLLILSR